MSTPENYVTKISSSNHYFPSGHVSFLVSIIDEYLYRLYINIIYIIYMYAVSYLRTDGYTVNGSTLGFRMH